MSRLAAIASIIAIASAGAFAQVATIDGRNIDGKVESIIDGKVTVVSGGQKIELATDEMLYWLPGKTDVEISKISNVGEQTDRCVVMTGQGDAILATGLKLAGGKFQFNNPSLGSVQMEMVDVKSIFHPLEDLAVVDVMQSCRERKYVSGSTDLLVVAKRRAVEKKDGAAKKTVVRNAPVPATTTENEGNEGQEEKKTELQWFCFEGAIKSIAQDASAGSEAKVGFSYQDEDKSVGWSSVPAIFLPVSKEPIAPAGRILCTCGSQISFMSISLAGGKLAADVPGLGKISVGLERVAKLDFNSPRLAMLQDLTPASVEERGFFKTTFKYRKNLAVSGEGLMLDGQKYQYGLGLHSYSCLSYDIEGKYKLFTATVGIDDAARPRGDATLTIFGDGKELLKPTRLTGADKSQAIRLDVSGVKNLTIKVDFGQDNIDVSDHVDIVDPRLIK